MKYPSGNGWLILPKLVITTSLQNELPPLGSGSYLCLALPVAFEFSNFYKGLYYIKLGRSVILLNMLGTGEA